jgi:hypothetical protein
MLDGCIMCAFRHSKDSHETGGTRMPPQRIRGNVESGGQNESR